MTAYQLKGGGHTAELVCKGGGYGDFISHKIMDLIWHDIINCIPPSTTNLLYQLLYGYSCNFILREIFKKYVFDFKISQRFGNTAI